MSKESLDLGCIVDRFNQFIKKARLKIVIVISFAVHYTEKCNEWCNIQDIGEYPEITGFASHN